MVGRSVVRVVCGAVALSRAGPSAAAVVRTMLGFRSPSSWKCTREATSSLENSLAVYVPAEMGATKRGQRAWQTWRKEGRVREAAFARESWAAPQKRVQRSAVSCGVEVGIVGGGSRARILTNSCFL